MKIKKKDLPLVRYMSERPYGVSEVKIIEDNPDKSTKERLDRLYAARIVEKSKFRYRLTLDGRNLLIG